MKTLFIGVTGAHSVGKTTFCGRLQKHLSDKSNLSASILDGIGDRMKSLGVPLGTSATPDTVAAIYAAHLSREASAPSGIVLLDRCLVDALAYVRSLHVNSIAEQHLYQEITNLASRRLDMVVHLDLGPFFSDMCAEHETPALRRSVADAIPAIIREFKLPHMKFYANNEDAVKQTAIFITEKYDKLC